MANMLFGGVADRLVPILQTPVEDIIYEVLDQKGFPTRQEVRELRNKLDRLEKSVENLNTAVDSLQGELERAAAAAEDALARAKSAQAGAAAAPAPAGKTEQTRAAPRAAAKVCKVESCENSVRARGFCARHYQQWKRATLDGFVYQDGTTIHEAVRYVVGEDAAGQVVEVRYEADEVIFLLPESERTLRVKVDDVRRYD